MIRQLILWLADRVWSRRTCEQTTRNDECNQHHSVLKPNKSLEYDKGGGVDTTRTTKSVLHESSPNRSREDQKAHVDLKRHTREQITSGQQTTQAQQPANRLSDDEFLELQYSYVWY